MEDQFDTSFHANGRVGYQLSDFWAVEAEGGWTEIDFADTNGDVRLLPAVANLKLTLFPGEYVIDPYLFAGGGYSFNDINLAGVEVDDDFVIQAGAGVKFHINEAFSLYGEGRYFYHRPDVSPALFGDDELELDAIIVGGGATFRF
jgi:outer membrane protein W